MCGSNSYVRISDYQFFRDGGGDGLPVADTDVVAPLSDKKKL